MARIPNMELTVRIKPVFDLSLWDAIKIRIAGRRCETVIKCLLWEIVTKLDNDNKKQKGEAIS